MEKSNEKILSQTKRKDNVLDYVFKFTLGSTVFAALIGVALTIYVVCLIVNK